MNQLIDLRNTALRLLGGGRADEVLNPTPHAPAGDADLPAALAAALRDLKVAAISDDGARVGYDALRAAPAYRAYRAEVTARLPAFDPAGLPTRATRLAFWINLYNAMILDGVVRYELRGSVLDAAPAAGFFRRIAYCVGGDEGAGGEVEPAQGLLRVSKIFSWYRDDFGGPAGVVRFVRDRLPDDERRRWLGAQPEVDLAFKPYDWALNT
jgi:hypothetical protein